MIFRTASESFKREAMHKITENTVRLSVRELVEFVLKSGDIDTRRSGPAVQDAMLLGTAAHRRLQKAEGGDYEAEVPLKYEMTLSEDPEVILRLEGRADGIYTRVREDGSRIVTIDEIKGVYRDIHSMEAPVPVHLAQAAVYAFIKAEADGLSEISVRMTYTRLPEPDGRGKARKTAASEESVHFITDYTFDEIRALFTSYTEAYRRWAVFIVNHRQERKLSAAGLAFPYAYRPGQREIARQVYRTIEQEKNLFVQAPTGIGKTLAMLYPSVQAVGQDLADRIFYLTAKTVTAGAAEEAMAKMAEGGLRFSFAAVTAKEKLCPLGEMRCDPEHCPRAKGHFDRINDAVFDLVTKEQAIRREVISRYAEQYNVCPFELCLDATYYTDVVICDYNYAFAPHVALKRYFAAGTKNDFIFLIDEAHNLPDRAREMFSAVLVKEEVLAAKKLFQKQKTVLKWLDRLNRAMLALKRECDRVTVFEKDSLPNSLYLEAAGLYDAIWRYLDRSEGSAPVPEGTPMEEILSFFYRLGDFISVYETLDDGYTCYAAFDEAGQFLVRLFCIRPAGRLRESLENVTASIFFSATLLPVNYYKELLTGNLEEEAMYVNSPFDTQKRALLLSRDVTSRYQRRNDEEFRRIASYIEEMVRAKKGNYLAFFPSHFYLSEVSRFLTGDGLKYELIRQKKSMTEDERQAFLHSFSEAHALPLLGLSVTGGVFSEGIDLKNEQLIGVAVVGTGLPQVCTERELIRAYYEGRGMDGFDFAYRFPGFNKVMQAAGRLIRTTQDEGVILLLDERFRYSQNLRLFPREWTDYRIVSEGDVREALSDFWKRRGKDGSAP